MSSPLPKKQKKKKFQMVRRVAHVLNFCSPNYLLSEILGFYAKLKHTRQLFAAFLAEIFSPHRSDVSLTT